MCDSTLTITYLSLVSFLVSSNIDARWFNNSTIFAQAEDFFCVNVCMCACESMYGVYVCVCVCLLSVRLIRYLSVCGGNSRRRWCCDSHLSIIKDGSSALGSQLRPSIDQSQMSTDLNRPVHDTWHKRTDNSFHNHPIHPPVFCLSFMSLGPCTVSIRSLTPSTHMLSPSTSLSIILSLMANLIAIELRDDDDGREAKRDEEDIPIGNIHRPRRGWLRTLSRWPLSLSRLCLTPPQLCLSSNTKDCEELIGSKGTDTWHIHLNPDYYHTTYSLLPALQLPSPRI